MSFDIEHRACFDLPAPGIIATHYGTEHHASDALEYYLQGKDYLPKTQNYINKIFDNYDLHIHKSNLSEEEKAEKMLNHMKFSEGILFGGSTKIPKGNYQVSYGGMLAGKTHAKKIHDFLYGDHEKIEEPRLHTGTNSSEKPFISGFSAEEATEAIRNFSEAVLCSGPVKTPFEKAIEEVAEKSNEAGEKLRATFEKNNLKDTKPETKPIISFNNPKLKK